MKKTLVKCVKNWRFHNIVAHPLFEILQLIGLRELAVWVHDSTTPE